MPSSASCDWKSSPLRGEHQAPSILGRPPAWYRGTPGLSRRCASEDQRNGKGCPPRGAGIRRHRQCEQSTCRSSVAACERCLHKKLGDVYTSQWSCGSNQGIDRSSSGSIRAHSMFSVNRLIRSARATFSGRSSSAWSSSPAWPLTSLRGTVRGRRERDGGQRQPLAQEAAGRAA
jgi:hypothetical protein